MRTLTPINNERGGMAALLSVIVLSLIMVSTLTSFYTYLENRARFQERIRINYQMGYVVEDMTRALIEGHKRFLADPTCGGDPTVAVPRFVDCTQVCAPARPTGAPAGTPDYSLCVQNDSLNKIVNNADFFCAYNTEGNNGATQPSYCGSLVNNDIKFTGEGATAVAVKIERSKVENWYARLDNFFDTTIVKNAPVLANKMYPVLESRFQPPTLLGWLLPQTAVAASTPPDDPPPYTQPGGGTYPTNPSPNTASVDECTANPELDSCAEHCEDGPGSHPFCKNALTKIRVGLVDGGCSATSTDLRCKRCTGVDRRTGQCVKISICPPWVPARDCMGGSAGVNDSGSDKRIHQMVKLNSITLDTFMWGVGEWGVCASNNVNRNVFCRNVETSAIVADASCPAGSKPANSMFMNCGDPPPVGGGCGVCEYISGTGLICYLCP